MSKLNPQALFKRLAEDLPANLLGNVFVTGSLAAAYAHQVRLTSRAVNTKDADLLVHPAGDVRSARDMAQALLNLGWRRTDQCKPSPETTPPEEMWAIRLLPPLSNDYFVEFLNVPKEEQPEGKRWIPVQLADGWYGLPSFRFMGLTAHGRRRSNEGLEYAAPEMMALANLMAHRTLTADRIESGDFKGLRRCAKDLGRVIALAYFSGRQETEGWVETWRRGLQESFPQTWSKHAATAGDGLRQLLADDAALEEARKTTELGLLSGLGVGIDALRGVGERLVMDAIEPLEEECGRRGDA